jgi:outer membrane protein OmpA-like peptidoglycan-associated protein
MMRLIRIGILISLTAWPAAVLAMDCRLGADYYRQAGSETDPQQVVTWLQRSAQVCPNFNAWYMLGLIYAQQGQTNRALEAFAQAEIRAGSSKTEALALARRGELLARTGRLPAALRHLELAQRFHPAPTPDWLEAALKRTRIQACRTLIPAADIADTFGAGTRSSTDGRFAVRPAVNLPVHFAFDQADLTSSGRRQVAELGRALANAQFRPWSFLLVGHTDRRGPRNYNQHLSELRAATVKLNLERQFPSLRGRLAAEGRGETELLYDGNTDVDHMLNRRVKVTLYD